MKLCMICGLTALLLAACALDKSAKPADPVATKKTTLEEPKLVGRIASIPGDRRFVLIQSYGKWEVTAGTILISRGPEERTANLLATGEVLGEFAAADLQSGLLEVGDAVYFRPAPKATTAPVEESPETGVIKTSENIFKNI